jgi:5-methylcytosine-specific restriction endonuclease McrA
MAKAKRSKALYWYNHHREKAQRKAEAQVNSAYAPKIDEFNSNLDFLQKELQQTLKREPFSSKFIRFFGGETDFYRTHIAPLEQLLNVKKSSLIALKNSRDKKAQISGKSAIEQYEQSRKLRKEQKALQEERSAELKYERRIRWLERSKHIRMAASSIRKYLLAEVTTSNKVLFCHYCGAVLNINDMHLDHKKPVSRGGRNNRENLVWACAACNLSKGRKLYEDFVKKFRG